jgi:hypothetical protein
MKTFRIIGAIMFVCLISLGNVVAQTSKVTTTKKTHKTETVTETKAPGMNTYFVSAAHTPEQCVTNMDEMKAKGDKALSKFKFGCMSGDHTMYGFIQAASADEARQALPLTAQTNAKVVKVDTFTAKQVMDMHKDMK